MTLDDLIVDFSHLESGVLLKEWRWLVPESCMPIMVTAAGDAFVQNVQTGNIYFVDTVEGRFDLVADNDIDFKALLTDPEFVTHRFSYSIVAPLLVSGVKLGPGQVFSFKKPPVLGGEYHPANLEPADMDVHFSRAGRIWSQVKDLPEGAPIDSVTAD